MAKNKIKKIVLAYSGGLDTSVILPWLKEKYDCEMVAFAADVGQGEGELDGIEEKAYASGADEVIVADLRQEFAEQYCWPMLQAGATYEDLYMLGTSIARPLIAKAQVDCAKKTRADAVAHGATGKGNDQVRFELTFMALAPKLAIIAPWKDPSFELTSRSRARRRSTRATATSGTSPTRVPTWKTPPTNPRTTSGSCRYRSPRRPTNPPTCRWTSRKAFRWASTG
jgi:argininosuccinate synthase